MGSGRAGVAEEVRRLRRSPSDDRPSEDVTKGGLGTKPYDDFIQQTRLFLASRGGSQQQGTMTEEKNGIKNGAANTEMAPQEDGTKVPLTNDGPEVSYHSNCTYCVS